MAISKVGVLGAGTMGAGIAQVCAEAGFEVVLVDINDDLVAKGLKTVNKAWAKAVEKGKKEQSVVDGYKLASGTDNNLFADCDIVIEAIIENINIKKTVMKELDGICKADAILATNTSALSITEIAAATGRPDKVLGMHFFNPVPAMKLVEVIRGASTDAAVVDVVVELSKKVGKVPIPMGESPGFIVNRILVPYINEAATLFGEGVASAADIDQAMKLGANMPMGPLALADLVGIDVVLMVMDYFLNEFGDSKYRPALSLRSKVRAGHLGRKTGKGFYDYN